jgi:hypothetical protein
MDERTIQHVNPVWREKTNYIIRVNIGDIDSIGQAMWEQLWVRKRSETIYEICCIPFHLYNVSLGDVVRFDEEHSTLQVVSPSGHYTFRVWFGDSKNPDIRDLVIEELAGFDCLLEWYSENLLAIDVPDASAAQLVANFLAEKEDAEDLVYETGRL